MKRERKTTKIPIGNYPIQTLGRMLLNPSRPSSSELVELHVFYVPEGSWSYKLNTISLEVINEFVSAGFLRVSPQLTLQGLRERLGEFLGEDAVAEKFLFLKCVGNHLAVVKEKQESELKLKSFASPYAFQSELYLLPVMDHLGNVYSEPSAVTLEEQQINDTAEADKTIHRPVKVILSMDEPGGDPSFLNDYPEEAEERVTPKKNQTAKNHIGNFEVPGSLEESSGNYSNEQGQLLWKNKDDITINRRQTNQEYEGESVAINTESIKSHQHLDEKEYNTLPDLIDFPSFPFQPVLPSAITDGSLLRIERQKIIEQMKQVREERKYLENVKEELNKKVEKLFEQSKLKRYQACDNWKKKYFETKKVTASLEEVLTKLREDLELYYKKLLMQLEAREIKMRPKNLANISDSKNNLIIQITEVQHAIDQLKRKLDTDKMKLIIEVKMRKQAVSDIRTLKAELTQKKINPTFNTQLGSIGCCNTV